MYLIKDLMGLQHHKQKHAQKPSDHKQQQRPLAPYCLFIHHNHTEKCIRNMNVNLLMLKDFSTVCWCCWLCHSHDPAVPCVCRPELLKRRGWQHEDRLCLHSDSAVVRGQQRAGHRLDCSSETPTESNLACDIFFSVFVLLEASMEKDTVAAKHAPWHQNHSKSCSFSQFQLSSPEISYTFTQPTPRQRAQHGCQLSLLPPLTFHLTFSTLWLHHAQHH